MTPVVDGLSYDVVGLTTPADEVWTQHPAGYRRRWRTVCIGQDDRRWNAAAAAVLDWRTGSSSHEFVILAR